MAHIRLKILLINCFIIWWIQGLANDRIDSLMQAIPGIADDSTRLRLINEVSFHFIFNDSDKAIALLNNGLSVAKSKGLVFCENELTNTKGIYFDVTGARDSAGYYMEKALMLSREQGFKNLEKMSLNSLGLNNWNSGNFRNALDYFLMALEINKKYFSEEKESEANYRSNIGLIYQELKQYQKAIEYHLSALSIRDSLSILPGKVISLANLGVCYKLTSNWDKAENSYLEAQKLAKETNNLRMYYSLKDNLGNLYLEKGQYDIAIKYLKDALDRPEQVGYNPKSDLSTLSNLVAAYTKQVNPKQSLIYAQQGFEIIDQNPELKYFAATLYKYAAESHFMLDEFEKGRTLLEEFITINDSIFTQDHAQALADLEIKFETEEKEVALAKAEASLAQNKLRLERQNLFLYGGIGLFFVFLSIGLLLLRQQKLKSLQIVQRAQLAEANIQLEAQKKLNEQRLHIARELHDNIGTYLTFMKTSLEKWQDQSDNIRVKEVVQLMKKTATELRHTVWILNNEEISLEEIVLRLRDLMQFNAQDIAMSADVIGDDQLSLDNIKATHLIRVIQEAINNALKHAFPTQIDVLFYCDGHEVKFEVIDNGQGFDPSLVRSGNGIANMKYRMQQLGGVAEIESSQAGTKVKGSFTINHQPALK